MFLAVFGAAAILGLVVSLTPQFLSSAASAALNKELAGRCDSSYAGSLRPHRSFQGFVRIPGVTEENREKLALVIAQQPNLGPPRATIRGIPLTMMANGAEEPTFNMNLLYRTGWEDQVKLVRGDVGSGVSIDEYTAENYGVDVGDQLGYEFTVALSNDRMKTVRGVLTIGSIHEDLVGQRNDNYWCDVSDLVGLSPAGDRLSPVGFVPLEVFGDGVFAAFEDPPDEWFLRGEEYWELPVELQGLTLGTAHDINAVFNHVGKEIASNPDLLRSDLETVSDRVDRVDAALATSVRPLAIVVIVVAFALMAGAGSYWVDRRANELRLLSAIGIGPAALGWKASMEMVIPVVVGVALGSLVSYPVASVVGPGGTVEWSAVRFGWLLALPTVLIALLLVGIVAALRSRQLLRTRRAHTSVRWWTVPLALVLLVGAYLVRSAVGEEAVRFGENELVGFVDPLVILFPLLFFSGVVLLASEVFLLVVRRLKTLHGSNSIYLALRRITSNSGPVVVLIAGALIPIATLVYSTALTRSSDESVQVKGRVFIGSEIRAPVYDFDPLPSLLIDDSTYVRRADRVEFEGTEVDLLVVDRATFEKGAFWDRSFSDQTLESLLEQVGAAKDPLPAILANAPVQVALGTIDMGRFEIPIEVVTSEDTFPGARIDRPLLVVDGESFDDYVSGLDLAPGFDGTDQFLWTKNGDVEEVEHALSQAEIGFAFTTSVDEALDLTKFQVIIWTFDFLELYAGLAGIIVVGAILLYADTRQRERNLSYALAVRMGLTRREHLLAGFFEFGGLVFLGGTLGSVVAYLAARSIYPALDALPSTPPPPHWVGVFDITVVLGILALIVGSVASYVAQRTADNADVSELLRHGG